MKKSKTAVIGLGNIGFRFDLDAKRKDVWSHAKAYKLFSGTEITAAVEVNKRNEVLFKRSYPGIPVYRDIKEMMSAVKPEIVSICTPTASHRDIVKVLTRYPVKVIFCEKPLAYSVRHAREMVDACAKKGVKLGVNHIRRWDINYMRAKKIIDDGLIGKVRSVSAFYSGQIFNMGTHLFDTMRMLTGADPELASGIGPDRLMADPSISGWIKLTGGILCSVNAVGKREDLIFEIDIIGDKGRVRILENGEKVERFVFKKSKRYSGYRELYPAKVKRAPMEDRFIAAVRDMSIAARKPDKLPRCTGRDGLLALSMSAAMVESARFKGMPKKVMCA